MKVGEWSTLLYRTRVLQRLKKGGAGSKSRIVMGSGFNTERGWPLLRTLESEGLISVKSLGRMGWVDITQMGRQYLRDVDKVLSYRHI